MKRSWISFGIVLLLLVVTPACLLACLGASVHTTAHACCHSNDQTSAKHASADHGCQLCAITDASPSFQSFQQNVAQLSLADIHLGNGPVLSSALNDASAAPGDPQLDSHAASRQYLKLISHLFFEFS